MRRNSYLVHIEARKRRLRGEVEPTSPRQTVFIIAFVLFCFSLGFWL